MGKSQILKDKGNKASSRTSVVTTPRVEGGPGSPQKKLTGTLKNLSSMPDVAYNLMSTGERVKANPIGNRNPFIIEYYYLIDRTIYLTGLNKNKDKKIQISDREELFPMIIVMVKTLKDLVNGAAFKNQELVYQLGIDIFMNTVLRIIDDIEDDYYQMKEEVLAF